MDAVAGGGGVEQDAGEGVDVVGGAGALVGGGCGNDGGGLIGVAGCEDGAVGLAGKEDGEVFRGEQGTDAGCKGEGDVLLEQVIVDVGAGVGAAVGGVEEDEVAVDVGDCGFGGGPGGRRDRDWGGGLAGEGGRGGEQERGEFGLGVGSLGDELDVCWLIVLGGLAGGQDGWRSAAALRSTSQCCWLSCSFAEEKKTVSRKPLMDSLVLTRVRSLGSGSSVQTWMAVAL